MAEFCLDSNIFTVRPIYLVVEKDTSSIGDENIVDFTPININDKYYFAYMGGQSKPSYAVFDEYGDIKLMGV